MDRRVCRAAQARFIAFEPRWAVELETLDRAFVANQADAAVEAVAGPDNPTQGLPDLDQTVAANRKLVATRHAKLAGLVRA